MTKARPRDALAKKNYWNSPNVERNKLLGYFINKIIKQYLFYLIFKNIL